MLNVSIDTITSALVLQLLVDVGGKDNVALHFNFDLSLSYHPTGVRKLTTTKANEETFSFSRSKYGVRQGLHLLYHLKAGYGSVDVFSAITESPFDKCNQVASWKHETSHDSCWANLPLFSTTYFGMANKINAMLKEDGFEEVAPVDMFECNAPCLFNPRGETLFNWVPVEVSKDPQDKNNYKKIIKVLPKKV